MSDIGGYRLLFDPATQAPTPPAPRSTAQPVPKVQRALNRLLLALGIYAAALVLVALYRTQIFSFLERPLFDAIRELGFNHVIHQRYDDPTDLIPRLWIALLLSFPFIAVILLPILGLRRSRLEGIRRQSLKFFISVLLYLAGALAADRLLFPWLWPLLQPLDNLNTFGARFSLSGANLNGFVSLHTQVMLLGGMVFRGAASLWSLSRREARA